MEIIVLFLNPLQILLSSSSPSWKIPSKGGCAFERILKCSLYPPVMRKWCILFRTNAQYICFGISMKGQGRNVGYNWKANASPTKQWRPGKGKKRVSEEDKRNRKFKQRWIADHKRLLKPCGTQLCYPGIILITHDMQSSKNIFYPLNGIVK